MSKLSEFWDMNSSKLNSVLLTLILGVASFLALQVWSLGQSVPVLQWQVSDVKQDISELQADVKAVKVAIKQL